MVRIYIDNFEEVEVILNSFFKKPSFVMINGVEIPRVEKVQVIHVEDGFALFFNDVNIRIYDGKILEVCTIRSEVDVIIITSIEDEEFLKKRQEYLDSLDMED